MDTFQIIALALGASWLSGFRLYGLVFTLGMLQKYSLAQLPGDLGVLSNEWVLIAAGILFVVEFLADKIPWVDSTWDAVHTLIRIPAGAVLASAAFAHYDPSVRMIAFLIGGTIAFSSHGTKASLRAVANASPEPVSNWLLSGSEDIVAFGMTFASIWLPWVAAIVVILAVLLAFVILPRIVRAMKGLWQKMGPKKGSPA